MSLMNDMLRDLDRRGGSQPDGAGQASHRARPGRSRHYTGWLLGFVLLVLVTSLVVWQVTLPVGSRISAGAEVTTEVDDASSQGDTRVDVEVAKPERSPEITNESAVVAALNQPAVRASSTPKTLSEQDSPVAQEVPEPTRATDDARIQALLGQARAAQDRDRLTRPAGDNAYEYYQQVLAVNAEHPAALAGLAAIAQRYRELAEAAMDRDALAAAQQFLRRARSVDPQLSGIQSSEERLQALQANTSGDDAAKSPEDAGLSALSVRLDPETDDRRRAEQAQQWWSHGQHSRARHFLEQTLAQWPDETQPPVLSTIALIEFYLESGDAAQAEQLLSDAQGLASDEQARLSAELWSGRGDNAKALTALENAAEQAADNEPFRALWARLNYAEGRHALASEHYRQLLNDFGGKPAYWLGLGLAEDARQRELQAQQAFEQALASGAYDDKASIRRYLEERISALARQTQNREP